MPVARYAMPMHDTRCTIHAHTSAYNTHIPRARQKGERGESRRAQGAKSRGDRASPSSRAALRFLGVMSRQGSIRVTRNSLASSCLSFLRSLRCCLLLVGERDPSRVASAVVVARRRHHVEGDLRLLVQIHCDWRCWNGQVVSATPLHRGQVYVLLFACLLASEPAPSTLTARCCSVTVAVKNDSTHTIGVEFGTKIIATGNKGTWRQVCVSECIRALPLTHARLSRARVKPSSCKSGTLQDRSDSGTATEKERSCECDDAQ